MVRPYGAGELLRPRRQDRHPLDQLPPFPSRALRVEIERTQRHDVVARPLDPGRRRHPKAVHVEDPAPHAELRDLGDRRHAGVTHRAEAVHDVSETPDPLTPGPEARFQHQPHCVERRRHCRPLRRGARGRDEAANPARQQRLEGLDALARDLDVRLFCSESLPLRIQRRRVSGESAGVREPALGVRRRRRDYDEHALREPAGQGRDEDRGTGAGESGHREPGPGAWETLGERSGRRQLVEAVDEKIERHHWARVATPSSTPATSRARARSRPLMSVRRVPAYCSAANCASSSSSAPIARRTTSGAAGVRSDSRASGADTTAPTVSAPCTWNATPGGPSASVIKASPRASRFTRASTNGTNAGDAGRAVQLVSRRLPSSTTSPARTSQGSPFTVARIAVVSPPPPPSRYRRATGIPLIPATPAVAIGPGVPAPPNRQATPRATSARFAWPRSAGSLGGSSTVVPAPPRSRSPTVTSLPSTIRFPCVSTASAAATNGPAPESARTRAGSATRHTNALRSSARSSSGSSTASPIHHPGATLGSGTVALDPGAASARPTS